MAKGGQFERDISRTLSLWWTGGKRDDIFWRTSQSGGRATARRKAGRAMQAKGTYGDLCAIDPIGQPLINVLSIEVKRGYSRYSIQDLIDGKPGSGVAEFIAQAKGDAEASGRTWMIIWKRDKREPVVIVPEYDVNTAFLSLGIAHKFPPLETRIRELRFFDEATIVAMHPLSTFLDSWAFLDAEEGKENEDGQTQGS
jgi:hypothetical protein